SLATVEGRVWLVFCGVRRCPRGRPACPIRRNQNFTTRRGPIMILRRTFLRGGTALMAAGVAGRMVPSVHARPEGAHGDLRLGVVGLGLKGAQLAGVAARQHGVRLVAVCEVDPVRLAEQVQLLAKDNIEVFATTDMRRLFERADVDAVIIATSTHWHALATIWACQA